MALTADQRLQVFKWMIGAFNNPPEGVSIGSCPVVKADLSAAVDATDTWIEANQASFNAAIPQPARGAMSTAQKTILFCLVALKRAGLVPTWGG